ncbi:Oxoglutarate/iron-dependent dioxygenase [Corchorus olitorius]|uniref:Oxoglutarate/iron-dependent dioxygenase n=1 Tax=Corchorus olitorius TaxID=93759 RepID=A0A1R3H9W1_9ROSI|nr:Oxoglutarate/iron-dependent dioxygenase [Corchorus olitorius]
MRKVKFRCFDGEGFWWCMNVLCCWGGRERERQGCARLITKYGGIGFEAGRGGRGGFKFRNFGLKVLKGGFMGCDGSIQFCGEMVLGGSQFLKLGGHGIREGGDGISQGREKRLENIQLPVLPSISHIWLQIKHGEDWVDVKPLPRAVIFNIADLLQIISNGEYNSVQHRVRANSCEEARISITEFFNLSKWKEYGSFGPLPELVLAEKPALYRQFTLDDFLSNIYSKEIDCKSLVNKLKL